MGWATWSAHSGMAVRIPRQRNFFRFAADEYALPAIIASGLRFYLHPECAPPSRNGPAGSGKG
ncbi:protein of unknown function [Nocardia cyriacigeorgica GUH-2]|uniref:Uncharacterized protein n=1 Tax=Nocardia cyriacigeorgica (strain GUH-2) TaxID=1127134 RepID=H6RAD6_NOCCG|nr:protein of unknown function [Nocardia cyriacigeorgica GUH-2]